jgi:hypothetical protein
MIRQKQNRKLKPQIIFFFLYISTFLLFDKFDPTSQGEYGHILRITSSHPFSPSLNKAPVRDESAPGETGRQESAPKCRAAYPRKEHGRNRNQPFCSIFFKRYYTAAI